MRQTTPHDESPPTPPTSLDSNQRWLAAGLLLGVSLIAFEATAVITALPTIAEELGGDSLYGVALAAYTLANLVSLVAAGQFVDRRGARPTYLLSIALFTCGLVVSGLAPTMLVVVLGRLMQGAGAGGLAPVAYAMVKRAFPDDRQSMMYVLLSAGWVLPSLIAPAFGGIITDVFGWRWVFVAIVPLALLVAVVATPPMRAHPPADVERLPDDTGRIGAAFVAASGVGLLVLCLRASHPGVVAIGSVAGAVLAVPALRRLLPAGFAAARPGHPAVLACRLLATGTFIGIDGFLPLAADRIHGASPMVQGFVIIGAALSWTGGQAIIARRPEVAPRVAVRTGFCLLGLSTVLVLPVLWPWWPLWATFLAWAVGGLGMGLVFNPTTVVAMSYAEEGSEGDAGAQTQLTDALGFSLMGGIGGALVAVSDRTDFDLRAALAMIFAMSTVCAITGIVASRGVRRAT